MKKSLQVLIITAIFLLLTVSFGSAEESGAYPQSGFDREWSGEWPDVGCAFTADKDEFSNGDKVVFSLSLSVPGEFDAAQCVPIYDVNVFEAENEGNVLNGGFAARGAAVLSQSYEEKSPAGDPVNAFNCVACYEKPIKDFKGVFFTFTLVAKDAASVEDRMELPVYVFVKLISETGENVVFEAKPSVSLVKKPENSEENKANGKKGGCASTLNSELFWLETAVFTVCGCSRGVSARKQRKILKKEKK